VASEEVSQTESGSNYCIQLLPLCCDHWGFFNTLGLRIGGFLVLTRLSQALLSDRANESLESRILNASILSWAERRHKE
jgi:hypothetical protein